MAIDFGEAIEEKMVELFRAVVTTLPGNLTMADLTVDYEERVLPYPAAFYPVIIITIDDQEQIGEATGEGSEPESGMVKLNYIGHIAIETRQVDHTKRNAQLIIERGVKTFLRTALTVCTRTLEENILLDNLEFQGEVCRGVTRGVKNYSIVDRDDNLFNRGEFTFVVESHRNRGN